MSISDDEAVRALITNLRTKIEEDMHDEEQMDRPDEDTISSYQNALNAIDQLGDEQYKRFKQQILDTVYEEFEA